MEVNEGLQQRAHQVMEQRNKGRPPINRDLSRLDGADTRYRCAVGQHGMARVEAGNASCPGIRSLACLPIFRF